MTTTNYHCEKCAELHDHYARNALACGHSSTCRKVVEPTNWPTMRGTVRCDCGRGEPPRAK